VLATLPLVAFAEIGFAVAFGVLLDTLVVRSILVTALNLDLGRRVWWPGPLSRRPETPLSGDALIAGTQSGRARTAWYTVDLSHGVRARTGRGLGPPHHDRPQATFPFIRLKRARTRADGWQSGEQGHAPLDTDAVPGRTDQER
jgi:MMPL family